MSRAMPDFVECNDVLSSCASLCYRMPPGKKKMIWVTGDNASGTLFKMFENVYAKVQNYLGVSLATPLVMPLAPLLMPLVAII